MHLLGRHLVRAILLAPLVVFASCSTTLLDADTADMSTSDATGSTPFNGPSDDLDGARRTDDATPPVQPDALLTEDDTGPGPSDASGDAAMDAGPDMNAPPRVPVCAIQCTTPADCAGTLGGGLFDEENYECEMGACRWLGCISDAECQDINPGSECKLGAFGFRSCLSMCTVPTDCAQAGMGPYDADNYDCVQGSCEYIGCNNDAECQTLGAQFRCRLSTTLPHPICQTACTVPADCASGTSGAYDADNYACNAGICEYQGCLSDAECQQTNPTFVCR